MLHRLSYIAFATALAATSVVGGACVGNATFKSAGGDGADAGSGDLDEAAQVRQQFEDEVAPLLTGFCSGCHGADTSVPFLAPNPDMYTTVMEWPNLVSLKVPAASGLLSKGAHDGPAWQADQAETIKAWIEGEAALAPEDEGVLETTPFIPSAGENTIDLGDIGLAGATLTFRMEPLSNGMYMSRMALNAAGEGIHVVHPTFVPWEGDVPAPDPVDRFSNLDMFVDAQQSVSVGGGTLILVDIPTAAPISVRFEVAEVAEAGDNTLAGCNDVASFTANAQPQLAQYCISCHAGSNDGATNATDMTRINDLSPEGQQAACGQILSRVNLLDPINSSIFLAPEPQSSLGHPYKLPDNNTFTAFRSALLTWITAEQNAAPQQ
jgi:cytochrome c553